MRSVWPWESWSIRKRRRGSYGLSLYRRLWVQIWVILNKKWKCWREVIARLWSRLRNSFWRRLLGLSKSWIVNVRGSHRRKVSIINSWGIFWRKWRMKLLRIGSKGKVWRSRFWLWLKKCVIRLFKVWFDHQSLPLLLNYLLIYMRFIK